MPPLARRVDPVFRRGLYCAIMYRVYGVLLRLAWAVVLPYQFVIALLTSTPLPRLRERLGMPDAGRNKGGDALWIHAVSVGEVRLALALAARLRTRLPGCHIHLTTVTATGRSLAEAARDASDPARPDTVSDLPFDLPGSMGRMLDALRPKAVLVIETEIWPNLLRIAGRRGLPVALVNGRISTRAFPRYRAIRGFLRRPLAEIGLFAMQSEIDASRIRALGAPDALIHVTGNLKFDIPLSVVEGSTMRRRLRIEESATVFVAGSTAPGEEAAVLHAFSALRRVAPTARLVLAPRHPRDLPRAEAALASAGLRFVTWTDLEKHDSAHTEMVSCEVVLVDTVGILPSMYAAADIVFVGGSLVPRGGQNILEPAAAGKPVLFGPHMENFRAAARALTDAGAGFVARNAEELACLTIRLVSDRTAYKVASTMARKVVQSNRGATERTLDLLTDILHPAPAGITVAPTSC